MVQVHKRVVSGHTDLSEKTYTLVKLVFCLFGQISYQNHSKGVKKVLIHNVTLQNCPLNIGTFLNGMLHNSTLQNGTSQKGRVLQKGTVTNSI